MKTKIGGQAVLEGVMMRGASSMALAVRDESGQIRMDTTRLSTKRPWYKKVPFLRGIINLIASLVAGTKTIAKSAEIMVEDEVVTQDDGLGWVMTVSMLLGVALALALFVWLPTTLVGWLVACLGWTSQVLRSLLEGVVKIAIIICYMLAISQMAEIKRVFMYHGAEHKTIACYESELPLTVQNVQKCSRYHDRCGTSFLVFVVVLSVILMIVLDAIFLVTGVTVFNSGIFRVLIKIAMLPLTAGVSYEVLMLLANSNFVLFRPLKWLGKQFQKLTTREPDDDMCQVAICAFNKVLQMDADLTVQEEHFPQPVTLQEFKQSLANTQLCKQYGAQHLDWLTCAILKITPQDLSKDIKVPFGWLIKLQHKDELLAQGMPIDYVVGCKQFFQRDFFLTQDVLIPRVETELVCEEFIKHVTKHSKVLDMCCGSGVLGITCNKQVGCKVTLADISKDALQVAKTNARCNKAKVKFVRSNMFAKLHGKYDAIICNPPYIPTGELSTLDKSVIGYEPALALDGGTDGLDFYRTIATEVGKYLTTNGTLVLEVGYNQGQDVCNLLTENGFTATYKKDYSNNDRIVIATKHKY